MSAHFTLLITGVNCAPQQTNGLQNVVTAVHWSYGATDGTFTTAMQGTTALNPPELGAFVPFDQLTEQHVASWVDRSQFAMFENQMEQWLNEQHNPQTVALPLPWKQ